MEVLIRLKSAAMAAVAAFAAEFRGYRPEIYKSNRGEYFILRRGRLTHIEDIIRVVPGREAGWNDVTARIKTSSANKGHHEPAQYRYVG